MAGALTAAGMTVAAQMRAYDAVSSGMAVVLTAIGAATATFLFWGGLRRLEVPPARRASAALWAALPWHVLMLSQIAYVGFALIPAEIGLSVWILRRRAPRLGLRACLMLASTIRILTLLVVYTAAAAMRPLWPWT